MTQLDEEFLRQPTKSTESTAGASAFNTHNCDILLCNFQIKKKRYRVLLNYDHLVWERLEAKRVTETVKNPKKAEVEAEHLSRKALYGNASHILHVNDIIKVVKGTSKASTLQPATVRTGLLDGTHQNHVPQTHPVGTASHEQYLTIYYAERVMKSALDCNRWRLRTLIFFNADSYTINQWHGMLTKALNNTNRLHVRNLLVFINPYGGQKQGLQVYERYCKPLFALVGIDASCIITQRANQIRDILMSHDLTPYDAICCVGGDGTAAEVINGLLFRSMRDAGVDVNCPAYVPKPTLPIAFIPAGSTDALAYSLHGTSDVRTAAIHLILGQRRGLDICSVHNQQGIVRFCASCFSYGFLGDVMAKSEKYRWMGTKRYEFVGVKAFLANQGYEAEIRFCVDDEQKCNTSCSSSQSANDSNKISDTVCYADCKRCALVTSSRKQALIKNSNTVAIGNCPEQREKWSTDDPNMKISTKEHSTSQKLSNKSSTNTAYCEVTNLNVDSCVKSMTSSKIQEESGEENKKVKSQNSLLCSSNSTINNDNVHEGQDEKWHVIKGTFFIITGANVSCSCTRNPKGVAPYNHLSDGNLYLVLVRKTSLLNNTRFLINSMASNGDIFSLPFVEVYHTKQFHFRANVQAQSDNEDNSFKNSCQPITDAFDAENNGVEKVSSWNCDGEMLYDLDVAMKCHCQLIDVFMRGPQPYNSPIKRSKCSKICCFCV